MEAMSSPHNRENCQLLTLADSCWSQLKGGACLIGSWKEMTAVLGSCCLLSLLTTKYSSYDQRN